MIHFNKVSEVVVLNIIMMIIVNQQDAKIFVRSQDA